MSSGNYTIEMVNIEGDTTETTLNQNILAVFNKPFFAGVRVPALPMDVYSVVEVEGSNFPANY